MIQKLFEKYLENLGVNDKSLKNYRSDLNHFIRFAILEIRNHGSHIEALSGCIPYLSPAFANTYKQYMIDNHEALKSINRRLSTLRKLVHFLYQNGAINYDFSKEIVNIGIQKSKKNDSVHFEEILNNYKEHLLASKASKNTIKNYLSDTRHFLSWLANNNN